MCLGLDLSGAWTVARTELRMIESEVWAPLKAPINRSKNNVRTVRVLWETGSAREGKVAVSYVADPYSRE